MTELLKVENLTKKFGKINAVEQVSFTLLSGEVFALVGPNGSGKTTLENCIVGLLHPDQGKVLINGFNVHEFPLEARKNFSYISDNPYIYPYLSGSEFIRLSGKLRGLSSAQINRRLKEVSEIFPIAQILDRLSSSYSRGNIEKTAFLASIVSSPSLLVIDEPIVGLDPESIKILGESLRSFVSKGGSVFVTTHTLNFAQAYADRVGFMKSGRLVKEIRPSHKTDLLKVYKQVVGKDE